MSDDLTIVRNNLTPADILSVFYKYMKKKLNDLVKTVI